MKNKKLQRSMIFRTSSAITHISSLEVKFGTQLLKRNRPTTILLSFSNNQILRNFTLRKVQTTSNQPISSIIKWFQWKLWILGTAGSQRLDSTINHVWLDHSKMDTLNRATIWWSMEGCQLLESHWQIWTCLILPNRFGHQLLKQDLFQRIREGIILVCLTTKWEIK